MAPRPGMWQENVFKTDICTVNFFFYSIDCEILFYNNANLKMQQCNSEWSGCTVILAQDSSKAHLTL